MKTGGSSDVKVSWVRRWWLHLCVALALLTLSLLAMMASGKAAITGISWGYESTVRSVLNGLGLCEVKGDDLRPYCLFDKEKITVNFGVYDPEKRFSGSGSMAIEHFYIAWSHYQESSLMPDLEYAASKNRWPLITIEPHPYSQEQPSKDSLFKDITDGQFDLAISVICGDIKSFGRPLFVRWGHEMEHLMGGYPWAQTDHVGYIDAYRYFVDMCRSITDNIFYVWSPVGNKELQNYWPGPDYADYVGLSIFGFPEWDKDVYGKERSFDDVLSEKYARIKDFDLPLMIAEIGVIGDEGYQWRWMNQAFANFSKYPLLRSVVYFNAAERTRVWGEDYSPPDWRIDPSIFD